MGERRILGRFIVMDPSVRGGEPTFRGTQLTVREVVEQIAQEQYWHELIERSEGTLSRRAIAEALALCVDAFHAETERLREREDQTPLALGDFILMHPGICHGQPTYTGSRVMAWQVLGQSIYARRFLRHPLFDAKAKRLGHVIRVSRDGLTF